MLKRGSPAILSLDQHRNLTPFDDWRPLEVHSAKMASGLRAFGQEYYWMDSLTLDGRGTLCVNICLSLFLFVWLHVMGAFMLEACLSSAGRDVRGVDCDDIAGPCRRGSSVRVKL